MSVITRGYSQVIHGDRAPMSQLGNEDERFFSNGSVILLPWVVLKFAIYIYIYCIYSLSHNHHVFSEPEKLFFGVFPRLGHLQGLHLVSCVPTMVFKVVFDTNPMTNDTVVKAVSCLGHSIYSMCMYVCVYIYIYIMYMYIM